MLMLPLTQYWKHLRKGPHPYWTSTSAWLRIRCCRFVRKLNYYFIKLMSFIAFCIQVTGGQLHFNEGSNQPSKKDHLHLIVGQAYSVSNYTSVGQAPCRGIRCVCLCVNLLFIFLHNCWKLGTENCNAGKTRYSLKSLLIRLKYCSQDMAWYAHLDAPLSAIQSPVKSKLLTTNCLSPW